MAKQLPEVIGKCEANMVNYIGEQLGNYKLIRLLGKGGFAEVYLGQHLYMHTQAAIKILAGSMTPQEIQKFTTEARIIANLNHPHILRIFEFGIQGSTPFLVIEYAPHGTLRDRHPRGTVLSLTTVVTYVKQIASALQYAHTQQQLVHRDVKPENMLIDRYNQVVLSDFGIAIPAHQTASLSTQEAIGTVTYMAPEQIKGKARPASDQYSLAVVTYEWLCGMRPFDGATSIEIAMAHLTDPPPPLRTKNAAIPVAVEQVVLKGLEKDPQRRYPSVEAFAQALEQAIVGTSPLQPAQSPPTLSTSTPLATQPAVFQNSPIPQPSPPIIIPTQKVPTSLQPPLPGTTSSIPHLSGTQQPVVPQRHISRRLIIIGVVGVVSIGIVGRSVMGSGNTALGNAAPKKVAPTVPITPTATTAPLGTTLYTYAKHNAGMRALAWSPKGGRVATASDDYTAQVWDALTGQHAVIYRNHTSYVEGVAWSPDGFSIVTGSADGTAQIWNSTTGATIYTYRGHIDSYPGSANQSHAWVNRVTWSPDGKYIVSCDQTSDSTRVATVQLWEAATGTTIATYRGHTNGVYAVAWSPNGSYIASAGYDGLLQIWDVSTGKPKATYGSNAFLFGLSWSPDNKYVAIGNSNNSVLVVDAASGNLLNTYNGHSAWVKDVAWSPKGKYIASGGDDGTIIVWDAATGANSYVYNGQVGHINGVEWSPDGKYIASGGDRVDVWQAV